MSNSLYQNLKEKNLVDAKASIQEKLYQKVATKLATKKEQVAQSFKKE